MATPEARAVPEGLRVIGVVRSAHTDPTRTPTQPMYATHRPGRVEVLPEFADGLADIEGFSHLYLVCWLNRAEPGRLRVKPLMHEIERGIFATRAPSRPNPLGLSLVRLVRREGAVLHLAGVDMLDGTPVLDIKPYARRFDAVEDVRGGWVDTLDDATAQRRGRREDRGPA